MSNERGIALVTVLVLLALIAALLASYFWMTRFELRTTKSSMDSFRGFYAAEAGLNLRANQVRATFVGYNRPAGASPDLLGPDDPCSPGNLGSGDFGCQVEQFQERDVATYLVEPPGNPASIVIPRGEPFGNLNAQEYRYVTFSEAIGRDDFPEAVLELHFKSRLVPMFQFAAFYNKDLEILPGPAMTLAGPVHTNGNLYLGTHDLGGGLDMLGQVTAAGDVVIGRKEANTCMAGPVGVIDPDDLTNLPHCAGGRRILSESDVTAWNDMVQMGFDVLTVPEPEALDPTPGEIYWDKADIRIVLDMNDGGAIKVVNPDGTVNALHTATLNAPAGTGCAGTASHTTTFRNNRENLDIDMLDVNAGELLDCIHEYDLLGLGRDIDESSEGGLVWYLGVLGPNQDAVNNYGVRVHGGADLESSVVTAPEIRGLTVVTNQAIYVRGDWNSADKKPAAFLADSLNVLSNNWSDNNDFDHATNTPKGLGSRPATETTINAAFLSGTDTTGGVEGAGGQDDGEYNGGLENYMRLHEDWGGVTLHYRGSFVSLNRPRHVDGLWVYGFPQYTAPVRDFGYDTDFNDAAKLPPLSPRFVYLRQELFVRRFEL